jgi:hypothetical protein
MARAEARFLLTGQWGSPMPEERDDPRRHGDKLEEAIRPKAAREKGGRPSGALTSADRQKPTPGSAEGERDVDDQDG